MTPHAVLPSGGFRLPLGGGVPLVERGRDRKIEFAQDKLLEPKLFENDPPTFVPGNSGQFGVNWPHFAKLQFLTL